MEKCLRAEIRTGWNEGFPPKKIDNYRSTSWGKSQFSSLMTNRTQFPLVLRTRGNWVLLVICDENFPLPPTRTTVIGTIFLVGKNFILRLPIWNFMILLLLTDPTVGNDKYEIQFPQLVCWWVKDRSSLIGQRQSYIGNQQHTNCGNWILSITFPTVADNSHSWYADFFSALIGRHTMKRIDQGWYKLDGRVCWYYQYIFVEKK